MKTVATVVVFLALVALLLVAESWLIQFLWNWLVPEVFRGPRITMLQAFGLACLVSLLTPATIRGKK